jgi:hypothetical protein
MTLYSVIAALIITLIITLIFSVFSKRPLGGLVLFFLVIFLATWTGQIWITPFGPIVWGIAWFPLIIVALFFSFLIFSLAPPVPTSAENSSEEPAFITLGLFFWLTLILLLVAIIIGYYRIR